MLLSRWNSWIKPLGMVSLAGIGVGLAACQRPGGTESGTHFAHSDAKRASFTLLGRLETLRMGSAPPNGQIRVCIQSDQSRYKAGELRLDVQLAYAAWLEAAGYDARDWQHFEFESSDACSQDGDEGALVRILGDGESRPDAASDFQPARLICRAQVGSVNCRTRGRFTTGVTRSTYLNTIWNGISTMRQYFERQTAPTYLSPNVNWVSLGADLERHEEISESQKTELTRRYDELVAAGQPEFSELVDFHESLAESELIASSDTVFYEALDEFSSSDKSMLDETYVPSLGAFHTLLHEIGHQFSMQHADNPAPEETTGDSVTTEDNENGRPVTEIASMAYGESYLYLTRDDRAGIASARSVVRDFLGELD